MTLLDSDIHFFTLPEIKGMVGYRLASGIAIVFGDPVCAEEDKPLLAEAFSAHCKKENRRVIYLAASESFSRWAIQGHCKMLLQIGEELVLDPHFDIKKGSVGRVIRRKTNHAERFGVQVLEYSEDDPVLRSAINDVAAAWLSGRKGPQIFLAHVDLFEEGVNSRYFYAIQGEKVVGVVVLHRLDARQGWGLHLLMITPDAEAGTSELLVAAVVEKLRSEGCRFLSFGVSQAEEMGEILGLGTLSTWLVSKLFKGAQKIFSLDGKRLFWKKFQPQSEGAYLLFSHPRIGLKEIMGIKRALNVSRGG